MIKEIKTRIQLKHDIEANWNTTPSFIPLLGEIILYDIDDVHEYERIKIGDGVTNITNLPFLAGGINSIISYEANQALTNEQQANARNNIGAADTAAVAEKVKTINGKGVDNEGNVEIQELPEVTETDNGKFLIVVDGAWAATQISNAEEIYF